MGRVRAGQYSLQTTDKPRSWAILAYKLATLKLRNVCGMRAQMNYLRVPARFYIGTCLSNQIIPKVVPEGIVTYFAELEIEFA